MTEIVLNETVGPPGAGTATAPVQRERLRDKLWPWRWWLALGGCLAGFIAFKIRDVGLPFFWDELGGYGQAALYLYDHGLSLAPGSMPPVLSRGHPLLLTCFFAACFRVFGAAPVVAHVIMLIVSVGLVVSVFHLGRLYYSAPVGLAAAALLTVQPIFLAQSTLLLPEVPLALTTLWTMHFFLKGRPLVTGALAMVAVLLKEPAIVVPFALGVVLIVGWFRARPTLPRALLWVAALLMPAAALGAFLLVQKQQNGWYFFPLHEGYIDFRWPSIVDKLQEYCRFVFLEQWRMMLAVFLALWFLFKVFAKGEKGRLSSRFGWSFFAVATAYLVFSAMNFFMKRYVLCLIPPFMIVSANALYGLVDRQKRVLVAGVVPLLFIQAAYGHIPHFHYDYDMSFRNQVVLQAEVTRYVEKTIGVDPPIYSIFPFYFGMVDPRFGYAERAFKHPRSTYSDDIQYIVGLEVDHGFTLPPNVKVKLMKAFRSPYMTAQVYKVVRD